jgi:hypothetical protein
MTSTLSDWIQDILAAAEERGWAVVLIDSRAGSVVLEDPYSTHGIIYRYLRDDRRAVTVTLGDWQADFSTGEDGRQPQRLTEWRIRPLDPAETAYLTKRTLDELEADMAPELEAELRRSHQWTGAQLRVGLGVAKSNDYGPALVPRAGHGR